jgi:flagellar hook assembly protein FlgD
VNGFTIGNKVSMNMYRDGNLYAIGFNKIDGQDVFDVNASLFAQATSTTITTGINVFDNEIKFTCFPNPFTDQITMKIETANNKNLEVNVFDINGKLIRKLYNGQTEERKTLVWDGCNDDGIKVVSGSYVIKANNLKTQIILKR